MHLTLKDIGKAYGSSSHSWKLMLKLLFGKTSIFNENDWVLKRINFSAKPGDAIGIIGANGAGKSTLLRMICGNLKPSNGTISIKGRIAAILELGMGFHPEFTGRQNAFLEAQINGFSLKETLEFLPEIEQFADIGEYFNRPVKIYSSGMLARLAFAIATAREPDILMVDEALSVGDLAFQTKCIQRMRQLKDRGTCILFVSHSLNLVREFCNKALYLSQGRQRNFGSADEICDQFQNDLARPSHNPKKNLVLSPKDIKPIEMPNPDLRKYSLVDGECGSLELEFMDFKVMDTMLNSVSFLKYNEKVIFKADIIANKDVKAGSAVGLLIADKVGYHLLSCNSNLYDKFLPELKKGQKTSMIWELNWPFQSGQFRIDIGLKANPFEDKFFDRVFSAYTLECFPDDELIKRNFGGYIFVSADVKHSQIYN